MGYEDLEYEDMESVSENLSDSVDEETETMQTEDIYRVYMEELAAISPCTEQENAELLSKIAKAMGQQESV